MMRRTFLKHDVVSSTLLRVPEHLDALAEFLFQGEQWWTERCRCRAAAGRLSVSIYLSLD